MLLTCHIATASSLDRHPRVGGRAGMALLASEWHGLLRMNSQEQWQSGFKRLTLDFSLIRNTIGSILVLNPGLRNRGHLDLHQLSGMFGRQPEPM